MMENQTTPKSKQKYRGWLTIRRSKPKHKYNLQNGQTKDSVLPYIPSPDDKDEDIPTLLRRLKLIEETEAYHDQHELVATQRHLIEVLKKENGALRLLRTQIESLRLENHQLKSDLETRKNGHDGAIDTEHLRSNGDATRIEEGSGDAKRLTNGHGREKEMETLRRDNEELRRRLSETNQNGQEPSLWGDRVTEGGKVNGTAPATGGNAVSKLKKEPVGPGPSGTSLVTVSCLLKCKGKFHDCNETMYARLKSYMATKCVDLVFRDWQEGTDSHQITLVLCHATSVNHLIDIRKALTGISPDAEIILIVYHQTSKNSGKTDPQTDSLDLPHNNICLVIDVFFSKNEGLYRCEQNDRAMSRVYRLFSILC